MPLCPGGNLICILLHVSYYSAEDVVKLPCWGQIKRRCPVGIVLRFCIMCVIFVWTLDIHCQIPLLLKTEAGTCSCHIELYFDFWIVLTVSDLKQVNECNFTYKNYHTVTVHVCFNSQWLIIIPYQGIYHWQMAKLNERMWRQIMVMWQIIPVGLHFLECILCRPGYRWCQSKAHPGLY